MKKGIKKYQWGTFSASGSTPQMVNPGNASLKQYTTTSSSTIPTGAMPTSGSISDLVKSGSTGGNSSPLGGIDIGGLASSLGGSIAMLINANKKDPNPGRPYKTGTKMIKYQTGTKSLTKEEGKVGKGSEYFAQAKKLSAQERAAFRKLDTEAKERGMTFEFKGLKYDPTNPANLSSPSRSNVGITYSTTPAQTQSSAQTTTSQAPAQGLVTDTGTPSQQPAARTARRPVGRTDAKTGYTIFPNNRVANPKNQLMGKIDTKGTIVTSLHLTMV